MIIEVGHIRALDSNTWVVFSVSSLIQASSSAAIHFNSTKLYSANPLSIRVLLLLVAITIAVAQVLDPSSGPFLCECRSWSTNPGKLCKTILFGGEATVQGVVVRFHHSPIAISNLAQPDMTKESQPASQRRDLWYDNYLFYLILFFCNNW